MQQQADQIVNGWMSALREDRKGIFQADLLRSIVFVLLAAGLCWFYFRGKIKPAVLLSGLLILSSFDLMAEGRKYLNEDSYTEPENIEATFSPTDADKRLMQIRKKISGYWILPVEIRFRIHGHHIFTIQ